MDYLKDDGFCRDGFILGTEPNKAGERLYGDLSFTYLPATANQSRKVVRTVEKLSYNPDDVDTLASEAHACEFLKSRLKSWTLKDRGGHLVPITVDTLAGMHTGLFGRLYNIVLGFALNDPKPGHETLIKRRAALQREMDEIDKQLPAAPVEEEKPSSDVELLGNSPAASG